MNRNKVTIPPIPGRDQIEQYLQKNRFFSPALEFDRLFPCWTKNRKGELILDKPVSFSLRNFRSRYNSLGERPEYEQTLAAIHQRLDQLVKAHGGMTLCAEVETELVLGLGADHPTENSFCFDRNSGAVYLPGSSIKGLCRAWAEDLGRAATLKTLFGYSENNSSAVGKVMVLDAFPSQWPQLSLEVITNHHPAYYRASPGDRHYCREQEDGDIPKNVPLDVESPVPVFHLALQKKTCEFVFRLLPTSSGTRQDLEEMAWLLAEGLEYLGIGARTAVGFGRMKIRDDDLPQKRETGSVMQQEKIMPGLIKTFISYCREDNDQIRAFLDQGSRLGVFPWLDASDLLPMTGESLPGTLQRVIQDPGVRTVTLFLSRHSRDASWVKQEMEWARVMDKLVIPVLLDKEPETMARLEEWLQPDDPLYIEIRDPQAPVRWLSTIARKHELDKAASLVLYLGHREGRKAPMLLPESWREQYPALVLGNGRYWRDQNMELRPWIPATSEEYQGFEKDIRMLLPGLLRPSHLRVTGLTTLGLAGLVGKHWNVGLGKNLSTWNSYGQEEWTVQQANPGHGSPKDWQYLEVAETIEELGDGSAVMLGHFSRPDRFDDACNWLRETGAADLGIGRAVWLSFPEQVTGEMAAALAVECAQSFTWCRQTHGAGKVFWFCNLPLAMMPLVTYLSNAVGPVTFVDFDVENRRYIQAFTLT